MADAFAQHVRSVHGVEPSAVIASQHGCQLAAIAVLLSIGFVGYVALTLFVSLFCGDGASASEGNECFRGALTPIALTALLLVATVIAAIRGSYTWTWILAAATVGAAVLHWAVFM